MGGEAAKPLELRRLAGRPAPRIEPPKPRQRQSVNALLGMGLWMLLWLGYNTDLSRATAPGFPANTMDLIHGLRAFLPMVAGWMAIILISTRASRLFSWIIGPLGLMLMYAVTGLISSATLAPEPSYALYFGFNYLSLTLVLLAIVLVENPLPDLLKVLRLTWNVSIVITISLLAAIPIVGSEAINDSDTGPIGFRTYKGNDTIMGMPTTRSTGFARYAAIAAIVALPRVMEKGKLWVRILWGIVFAASVYAEIIANGRTEIVAFLASVAIILSAEKARRVVNFMAALAALILLGFRGFYSEFFLYFTRTGHLDTTFTGRTDTWSLAWHLLWKSPWIGYGFQADRFFLGQHMHNAFLHVLFQAGFVGGVAILIGIAIVWYYTIYYFAFHQPADKTLIPPEIPAVLLFTTISSLTESTFAYYSAAWLLSAPIVGYVLGLHQHMRRIASRAAHERILRIRAAWRHPRDLGRPLEVPTPTPEE